ncbi:MAG: hypothetical protein RLY93_05060 [Sumerlaeia bacterium]
MIRLKEVLRNPGKFPWNYGLFMSFDTEWQLETECLVLDMAECDDELRHSKAEDSGMQYVIGMDVVQSIALRLTNKDLMPDCQSLLGAFLYYYDNDAFMEV